MSCGCKTSGDSSHNCGTKAATGCASVDTCGNSYKLNVFDWLSGIKNPAAPPADLVEVRFKNDRKCIYKNVNNLPLHIGSIVIVEASPGHDTGVVSVTGELARIQANKKNFDDSSMLKIYRHATQKDIEIWQDARNREEQVKVEARRIARALGLQMKITDIEFQGDAGKITFYYTAESRVDFRQLIKEYASAFRTRIDMKQIGFRQEAAKIGGIGSCGRELCCSSWLTDFRSVNTNAARYQQLSINPVKLAGQCGKLKCCLNYELDSYIDALSEFPSSSTVLDTEKGRAFCIKIDVFKKKMWFAYSDSPVAWHDLAIQDVKKMISANKKGEKAPPLEDFVNNEISVKAVDLIQENNVDRFDKKRRNKPRNNKKPENRNNNREDSRVNKSATNNQKGNNPQKEHRPRQEKPNRNQNQSKKKFNKKAPPKNNNEA